MDLFVIPLHLLVSHLLFDRHCTKFSISQKKQARQACMELLTDALHIFVPSVPKGKKNGGTENFRGNRTILSLIWEEWIVEPIKDTHPFGRTNPGVEKKTSLSTKWYCTNTFKLIQLQENYVRANPYFCIVPRERIRFLNVDPMWTEWVHL